MSYPGKRVEHELYEDQIPPYAPGDPSQPRDEVVQDSIDHGTSADGVTSEKPVVEEAEVEPEGTDDGD